MLANRLQAVLQITPGIIRKTELLMQCCCVECGLLLNESITVTYTPLFLICIPTSKVSISSGFPNFLAIFFSNFPNFSFFRQENRSNSNKMNGYNGLEFAKMPKALYISINDKTYTTPKVVSPINKVAMVYTCNMERISKPENLAITQK